MTPGDTSSFEAEREQRNLAEALREIGSNLSATLDFNTVLDRLLDEVTRIVPYDTGNIFLIEQGCARVVRARGYTQFGSEIAQAAVGLSFDLATTPNLRQMVETKQPLIIPDTATYSGWLQTEVGMHIRSWAGAPIIAHGQIMALFSLDKIEPNFYQPKHAEHLATFASQAAIAIKNAQLFEQTRHQAQQLRVLNQLAREMTGVLEVKNLCTIVAERVCSVFNYLNVTIFTFDLTAQKLVLQSIVGADTGKLAPGDYLQEMGAGLIGQAAQSGQMIVANDTQHQPDFFQFAGPEIRAELAIPLKVGEQLLGVLNVYSGELNAFNESDIAALTTIADQLAVALEKARLFAETHQRAEQLEALRRLSQDLTTLRDLDTLLQQISQRATQLLNGDGGSIFLYRPERQLLELVAVFGEQRDLTGLTLNPQEGFTGKVWVTREPLIANDYQEWSGKSTHWPNPPSVAIVGVPIQWGNEAVGVLNVIAKKSHRHFASEDATLLAQFASQAAIAIQNLYLYDQTQRYTAQLESRVAERTFELQALYELAQSLGKVTQQGDIVRLILLHLYQVIPHDVAASLLVTDTTSTLMIQSQRPLSSDLEMHIQEIMAAIMGHSLTDEPFEVHRIQSRTETAIHCPLESLASVMQVPIVIDEITVGLLLIATEQPYQFSQEQMRLLRTVADQAADSIRRLQSLLAAEHQRLESLVAHLPTGVILLDTERRIILANPAAQQCLAALTSVTVGHKLTHLGKYPIEILLASPTGGRGENSTVEVTSQSKQTFALVAEPLAVGPEAGGWLLVIWNNTEARATQERIKQQEQLAAVGQLAAGIAHDFNNILTSIIGFAELIRLYPDIPPAARDDIQRIINQGQRAARLIRQILDFSRQSIAEKRPFDLAPFLKETIKLLERTIPEYIRIVQEIEPNPDAFYLNADPAQIQQVLTNLAVNARDAMPEGGEFHIQLTSLTLKPDDRPPYPAMSPGNWIVLTLSDTGKGIPAEVLPRIFEPFFTTKEVGKGIGLGLAQVYGIITQHGGFIDVKTQVEKGTTFIIYLPALPPLQISSPFHTELETTRGNGELILLVEDDPDVLEITQVMLEHLGYQVITAINGRQALEVFECHQREIVLILTDVTMPEMGGLALAQILQAKHPDLKIIALTGYPLENVSKDILSQGIVDWLQKPLGRHELAQAISRSLKE